MVKRVRSLGAVEIQIKKEYLQRHLTEVEGLIRKWLTELSAPGPFDWSNSEKRWGWACAYRPPSEEDVDSNRMIRGHLRSRALWRQHADWERRLDSICRLVLSVQVEAEKVLQGHKHETDSMTGKNWDYTEDYLGVALWRAFGLANEIKIPKWYKPGDGGGVNYGMYKIEASAHPEEVDVVQREHKKLIYELGDIRTDTELAKDMKQLVQTWRQVQRHQDSMKAIVGKALKSSDILYPCRFCRHLWI